MALHYPTLGLVLLIVGLFSSAVMIMLWRTSGGMAGTLHLAFATVCAAIGYVGLWINPWFEHASVIISTIAALLSLLAILEGSARFKRYRPSFVRVAVAAAFATIALAWTLLHLQDGRMRYLVNDLIMALILVGVIIILLYRTKGEERLVFTLIAVAFALMAIAFIYRWIFAVAEVVEGGRYHEHMSPIILFSLVPWTFSWTYGFVLLANIKAQEALRSAALHDPLTGLYNRLWMGKWAEMLTDPMHPHCLVILDIDDFKAINDRWGHHLGDAVLANTAHLITSLLGSEDNAVRYGGDEFILTFDRVSEVETLKERVRAITRLFTEALAIEEHAIPISFSWGWAFYPSDGNSFDDLFKVADQRMYQMKRTASIPMSERE